MEQFPNVGLRFNRIGLPPKVRLFETISAALQKKLSNLKDKLPLF